MSIVIRKAIEVDKEAVLALAVRLLIAMSTPTLEMK